MGCIFKDGIYRASNTFNPINLCFYLKKKSIGVDLKSAASCKKSVSCGHREGSYCIKGICSRHKGSVPANLPGTQEEEQEEEL